MEPEFRGDNDHHDCTSDATPGGYTQKRRPGELAFALILTFASLLLLYSAYGISGFDALSAPGSVPMATTLAMMISAGIVALKTARLPVITSESFSKDILPILVILFIGFLVIFGTMLKPIGFLPTAALFLIVGIKVLARKGWGYTFLVALGSLVLIWIVFRIVFTVLLPAGIVPEAEFIQIFRNLLSRGAS